MIYPNNSYQFLYYFTLYHPKIRKKIIFFFNQYYASMTNSIKTLKNLKKIQTSKKSREEIIKVINEEKTKYSLI